MQNILFDFFNMVDFSDFCFAKYWQWNSNRIKVLARTVYVKHPSGSSVPTLNSWTLESTRREFLREILYKNIAIIAIEHGKFILLTPLAIFPILLGEIHSNPSGKFPYTY